MNNSEPTSWGKRKAALKLRDFFQHLKITDKALGDSFTEESSALIQDAYFACDNTQCIY